ncbi:uncharacterized protein [Cicer arietinum]|uniref:Protein NUCLEAR FUSION DEFECTIVE 6, chloroplastic/mitochondrial isoform X2 n=1 Tax=Cicer arietinum TaxID=3827 RepID=A0A1S2Z429_CICAR|nr:protein NUCLEAR FUSION DEFECTIVE 6, chloroplastic/mitochondrial isoform X2 [Cicer arietinum]
MAVAANCARKSFQIASSSAKTLISRRSTLPSSSNSTKFNASFFQSSSPKRSLSNSWFPVQLAGAQVSLTPLHSATASALFTSLLSLHNNNWGCLSEADET